MSTEVPYMTIEQLAEKLHGLAERLSKGLLQSGEITEMNLLARQLYERTVVLQFKAFEEQVQAVASAKIAEDQAEKIHPTSVANAAAPLAPELTTDESTPANTAAVSEPEAMAPTKEVSPTAPAVELDEASADTERPAFRISTAPQAAPANAEVSPKQISLIDSIEELSRMEQSINDKFKKTDSPTLAEKLNANSSSRTLSDKLKLKPVANLKTAIGINMRFQFTSTLFEGDAEAYNIAIDKLNSFNSYLEADDYIQNQLKQRYDWEMRSPAVKELLNLVERRYL